MMENIYKKIVKTALQYHLYSDLSDYLTRIYLKNRRNYPRFGYALQDYIEKLVEIGKYNFVNVTYFYAYEIDNANKIVGNPQMVGKIELLNDNERISGIKRWIETYYIRFHKDHNKKDWKKLTYKSSSVSSIRWLLSYTHLKRFYKVLVDKEVIQSKEETFYPLFSGQVLNADIRIKWMQNKTGLFVFLRDLKKAGVIRYDEKNLNTIVFKSFSQATGYAFKKELIRLYKSQSKDRDISLYPILQRVLNDFSESV